MQWADFQEYFEFLEQEKVTFPEKYIRKYVCDKNYNSFDIIKTIGIGTFGRVLLVQEKEYESSCYAMKLILKKFIIDAKQLNHMLCEKRILQSINFTFTVNLVYFFMDNSYLYLLMPFVAGGELYRHFRNSGPFSESDVKFYSAQVVLALQYLHNFDIIYRDLKPENLLIDERGYLKLTDFGLAKIVKGRTYTLCGTPDYIAPETVLNKGYGKTVDFWALGILIYELVSGHVPFFAMDLESLYKRIISAKIKIPDYFTKDLRDFLKKLVTHDMSRRLGNLKGGILDIMRHHWYREINWIAILNGKASAPHIPEINDLKDAENFEAYYDEYEHKESNVDIYKECFSAF